MSSEFGKLFSMVYGLGLVALLYAIWHLMWLLHRKLFVKLPPSEGVCLPLLGHMLHFRGVNDVVRTMRDKCKALKSPLIYFRVAGFDTVVICDYKLAVETFVNREKNFSDRPHFPVYESVLKDVPLTSDATPVWRMQRKLLHESLRLYGSGSLLEERSYDAVDKMLTVLRSEKSPFNPQLHLFLSVYHMITMICFDKSFELDDAEFRYLIDLDREGVAIVNEGVLGDFMPAMLYFPLKLLDVNQTKLKKIGTEYYNHITKMFKERRSHFDQDNPSCLVDHIVNCYEKLKLSDADEEERIALSELKLTHFAGICINTFLAGTETTSYTMNWFIYYMALYPDVQTKLHTHLAEVLGNRRPKLSDKTHLSYFRAVLHEVMRIATVAPLGIPHRTPSETTLAGYDIPANSMIVCNQWALHFDENYWGDDVESFKPERFLNKDGTLAPTPDSFMPFGCGRRICPGQSLAQQELLLLLVPLFQRLRFRFPEDYVAPTVADGDNGLIVRDAPPYQIEVDEL